MAANGRLMANFEVFQDAAGGWRFRLRADNGEIVATSEAYYRRDGALDGIDVVRRIAASSPTEETDG